MATQELVLKGGDEFWSTELQQRTNAHFKGRQDNMSKFKPGVETVILVFSDQKGEVMFRFPWYEKLKPLVEPIIEKVRRGVFLHGVNGAMKKVSSNVA